MNKVWIWIALCRKPRQVVAYAVGDRSQQTCRKLWNAIPEAYRAGHCYTDFWAAYQAVIPDEQHTAVGKETGETAHVERWNNTLRQRLSRFVRETLSFSKSVNHFIPWAESVQFCGRKRTHLAMKKSLALALEKPRKNYEDEKKSEKRPQNCTEVSR